MTNHFLQLQGVEKIYPQGYNHDITVLRDIHLTINTGDFAVVSGPSGSGKTTLLNMIGCLDKVTRGTIDLAGMRLTEYAEKELSTIRRDHIGFIFQAYNLIPVLTAKENIEYIMKLQGHTDKDCNTRSSQIAQHLEIDHLLNKLPNQLSGGQQQRVAVARAIAASPQLLLADEPTANLDSANAENLIDMMQKLNKREGVTIIFASHDLKIIEKAERSITMVDGRIVHDTGSVV